MSKIGWKCPHCGAILGRPALPPGGPFGIVSGTVRCAGCGQSSSAADVYGGKYDYRESPSVPSKSRPPKTPNDIMNVPGVGKKTAEKLRRADITSVRALKACDPNELARSTGIAVATAERIVQAACSAAPSFLQRSRAFFSSLFTPVPRCRNCIWWARAGLDGHVDKGICNFGTGQKPPFTMSVGQRVKIAWAKQRACSHFKEINLSITY